MVRPMRTLTRALLRDLLWLRGQVLATALVVACGLAIFVGLFGTWQALRAAQQDYSQSARFADVFASLRRAPAAVARELEAIPGVAAVVTRVVQDVVLDVPGMDEPARGRLVGTRFDPEVARNAVQIRSGRAPRPGMPEVVASEPFARAHRLVPGSSVAAVIGGRLADLEVVGIGLSPEFIYEIPPGGLFPDSRLFGVLWMDADEVARAAGMEYAFNDVAIGLAPGASQPAVLAAVDGVLERYGGRGAYGRDEQVSHRFISDEIAQNRVLATFLPAVFFAVAVFLLNAVLARLTAMQRTQIGTLRAFGYGSADVALHYVRFALVVVAIGGVAGLGGGVAIGRALTLVYRDYYYFPRLDYALDVRLVAAIAVVLLAIAVAGASAAALRIARLRPAEAMRPPAPPVYRRRAAGPSTPGVPVPASLRMVWRGIARRPLRSALGVLGIAAGCGLVLLGVYFHDAMAELLRMEYEVIQREDVAVAFHEATGTEVGHELARMPGVTRVELVRAEPARIRVEQRSRRIDLVGLSPDGELRRLVDARERAVPFPADGLVLSTKLAEILAVQPGSLVRIEFIEGERRTADVGVRAVVDDYAGISAYIDARALDRLASGGPRATGALLRVDPDRRTDLHRALKRVPALAGVSMREAAVASFRQILDRSFVVAASIDIVFACLIAFGLVYNGARIALSERANELATLRVLGFSRGETIGLLLGEQAAFTLAALPVGVAIGVGLAAAFAAGVSSELYRIPLVLTPPTALLAVGATLVAAILSGVLVGWRVRRLDLLAVLKSRE